MILLRVIAGLWWFAWLAASPDAVADAGQSVGDARAASKIEGPRAVFFGDSITEAWFPLMPDFFAHGYVARGVTGETTGRMLARFDRDVIALSPQVVVILGGTNDIAEAGGPYDEARTCANLAEMTRRAQSHGIRVVLASLLPARAYPWVPNGMDPTDRIARLNRWIASYAAQADAVYLDYYGAMRDEARGLRTDLGKDAVHPNPAGYRVMAPLAEEAIHAALEKGGTAVGGTIRPAADLLR